MVINKSTAGCIAAGLVFFIVYSVIHAQNTQDPNRVLPYRGRRLSDNHGLFYVIKIETEREHDDIEIKIKFNIPADPRTLQNKSVRINGKPLPPDARILFNKAGNKIKILVRASFIFDKNEKHAQPFQIDIPEAKGFNALPVYCAQFDGIYYGKEYGFWFSDEPPQKLHGRKQGTIREQLHGGPYGGYMRFEEDED